MNKNHLTIVGFFMFLLGMISIILSLVGLNLQVLSFIEKLGGGIAFLIKILIAVFGIIMVYLARTYNPEEE